MYIHIHTKRCVNTYTYTHVFPALHTHRCMYVYIYIYIYTHIHTYTLRFIYACVYAYVCILLACVLLCICMYVCMYRLQEPPKVDFGSVGMSGFRVRAIGLIVEVQGSGYVLGGLATTRGWLAPCAADVLHSASQPEMNVEVPNIMEASSSGFWTMSGHSKSDPQCINKKQIFLVWGVTCIRQAAFLFDIYVYTYISTFRI